MIRSEENCVIADNLLETLHERKPRLDQPSAFPAL
jgi:hypothetical protein